MHYVAKCVLKLTYDQISIVRVFVKLLLLNRLYMSCIHILAAHTAMLNVAALKPRFLI